MLAYEYFKDLTRTEASDKTLGDKAFNIAKNPKYDGNQRKLASMVCKFFHKISTLLADISVSSGAVKNKNMSSKELAK